MLKVLTNENLRELITDANNREITKDMVVNIFLDSLSRRFVLVYFE